MKWIFFFFLRLILYQNLAWIFMGIVSSVALMQGQLSFIGFSFLLQSSWAKDCFFKHTLYTQNQNVLLCLFFSLSRFNVQVEAIFKKKTKIIKKSDVGRQPEWKISAPIRKITSN